MQDEADILAHDFGFRAAVATGDRQTIKSALDNLSARFGIDMAFVIGTDGHIVGQTGQMAILPPKSIYAIEAETRFSGFFTMSGVAYEAVAAPIRTPSPAGWVVFAVAVGPDAINHLTRLSAIPLQAALLERGKDDGWVFLNSRHYSPASMATDALINGPAGATAKLVGRDGAFLGLAQILPGFSDGKPVVLLLRCSLSDALKPYYVLGATILVIGFLMVLIVVAGSWLLARTVTQPISDLERAARKLQRGQTARVTVRTHDEIARLGLSFNAMADDIEERTSSLQYARDSAESANRAKGVFLANMNHEVRTPLNGVVGVANLLAGTDLDANQRQMVELIESSGAALNRVLNDVLDMVDIQSVTLNLAKRPFNLGAVIRTLATKAATQAETKQLDFHAEIDSAVEVFVEGDVDRLKQILTNLLDNALKFTDQGAVTLCVGLKETPAQFRFEVSDTGIGFDQAVIEHLFTPFTQVDGSMTRRAGGTGLGLSLARDMARAMGGEIVGEGALGRGASFVLTLPLAAVDAPQSQIPSEQPLADQKANEEQVYAPIRVLLADDHAANRKVVEMILTAVDVELWAVENGAEAVDAYKKAPFDLVLMDLQMPVMDGLTAIKLIREYESETGADRTPILVISANVQSAHLRASAEAGADSHLAKPILAPTLIAAMDAVLTTDPAPQVAAA